MRSGASAEALGIERCNLVRFLAGDEGAIAANLAQELGAAHVWAYAQTTLASRDYQVLIDVQRFDSALGDAVTVEALWTIRRSAGSAPKAGRSSVREPASGAGLRRARCRAQPCARARERRHRRRDPLAVTARMEGPPVTDSGSDGCVHPFYAALRRLGLLGADHHQPQAS
jgi:hypothetical protein